MRTSFVDPLASLNRKSAQFYNKQQILLIYLIINNEPVLGNMF